MTFQQGQIVWDLEKVLEPRGEGPLCLFISLSSSEPLVQTAPSCCCTSFHYTHPGNVMVKDESAHNCPGYITHAL